MFNLLHGRWNNIYNDKWNTQKGKQQWKLSRKMSFIKRLGMDRFKYIAYKLGKYHNIYNYQLLKKDCTWMPIENIPKRKQFNNLVADLSTIDNLDKKEIRRLVEQTQVWKILFNNLKNVSSLYITLKKIEEIGEIGEIRENS